MHLPSPLRCYWPPPRLLTQALHANSGQEVLVDHLAQSTPGEEVVVFNQVPDGKWRAGAAGQREPGMPSCMVPADGAWGPE